MTAEHSPAVRSASQSSIPAVTPRPSRSSIATFPLSQTSLVSQLRRTSESSSQQSPASTTLTLAAPQTPASSIPSFRSIRSLLPFAPAKTSHPPPPSPSNAPKLSFVNFGSLRRMTQDRKSSATRQPEADQVPVIAIARPSQNFEEEMIARKRSRDTTRSTPDSNSPEPQANEDREHYALPLPSPGSPLGADLSTIIEAENSGISKHIPYIGDGTHGDGDDSLPTSPFNLEQFDRSRLPSPQADSRAASVLDLSTSKLAAEVIHAFNNEDATTASEWLDGVNGIVVEESADTPESDSHTPVYAAGRDEDIDATLDFGALDPALAELLSPNTLKGKSQSPSLLARPIPPRSHSRSPSHPVPASPFHLNGENGILPRISPHLTTVIPPTSRVTAQSLPSKRSASLSGVVPARGPSSSLPRLMRSVTNALPTANDSDQCLGLRAPSKKRYQPPSPLSSQAHSPQAPSPASSRGSTDMPPRRSAASRLTTPTRHVSSAQALGSSRLDETPAHIPSTSQKAMSPQAVPRSASDPTRQPALRPGLDIGSAPDINKRRRHLFYSRRRSMSVEEARLASPSGSTSPIRPSSSLSNRPPATEWPGPRTVKAFAAAGLLDGDRDGSSTHPSGAGKYATLRVNGERDNRFVPSRAAFSEAASTSSWGLSGGTSRVVTPSEGGVNWGSPTFSAPRTTFSGSSAPTSISATSSSQWVTVQMMKDKHELETEALLSALSDSQRATKTLREENIQLRDRIRVLQDELDELRLQMRRTAGAGALPQLQPPPPLSHAGLTRSSPQDQPALLPSPLMVPSRRPMMQRSISHVHHTNGFAISAVDLSLAPGPPSRSSSPSRRVSPAPVPAMELDEVAAPRPRRRRASTTSSVFPSLPQNMSLLTSETMYDHRLAGLSNPPSPAPPSPTKQRHPNLYNLNGAGGSNGSLEPHGLGYPARMYDRTHVPVHAHSHSSSLSSGAGQISPTIASFSLTEIPGSPSSLELRPEHELHLGDMASLSLYAMSDDEL